MSYDTLVRICKGLNIPRGYMGLAYSEVDEPEEPDADQLDEEMKRRALFGVASLALFGSPILGEILEISHPRSDPTPLPARLADSDLDALHRLTSTLRDGARVYGGGGGMISSIAVKSERLLLVPASEPLDSELKSAIADVHCLAGWTCVDSGLGDLAKFHFGRSMELAQLAENKNGLASAWWHTGIHFADSRADDDALKAYQYGLVAAERTRSNSDIVSMLTMSSASALARLGEREAALRTLKLARDAAPSSDHNNANWHFICHRVYDGLGDIDKSHQFCASAAERWRLEGSSHRDSIEADIALATLHVHTNSSDGPYLAHDVIRKVSKLSSVRVRQVELPPLVKALTDRGQTDLARLARQVINLDL